MRSKDEQTILAFLRRHPMAVISTIDASGEKTESALIAFAELATLELIFETFVDSRKYRNLQRNNHVSLVVGWDPIRHLTLQYEGEAFPVPEREVEAYRRIFLQKKTPCTETFLYHPKVRLFKVKPTWIAYADYTQDQPSIIELTF